MIDVSSDENQVRLVESFQELISTPYKGRTNAFCWKRNLVGDFSEIVNKLDSKDLTIKSQVAKLADGPPVNQTLVNEIKTKVEQGRYPIDLDIVTEKMFESFREAEG